VTVTHVGSTKKYSETWETIFVGKTRAKTPPATKRAAKKKAPAKKRAKR
jgi:hypothetical protein